MTAQTFPQFLTEERFVFTHGLFCVTVPVPRIATETDSGEFHAVGLPVGAVPTDREVRVIPPRPEGMGDRAWATRAGSLGVTVSDRTGYTYSQSIDATMRRDVGLDPDGATFDAVALAARWLAPFDVQRGKPEKVGGYFPMRVDGGSLLFGDSHSASVVPHALPLDGAVLALPTQSVALFALAVRFMRERMGLDVVGRAWFTQTGAKGGYWTLRAGVEREGDPTAPFAAIVAQPAPAHIAGDIRARALLANAQRERASFVVTRDQFARLFAGTASRALIVSPDAGVRTHSDGAARAVSVRADEVDVTAAIGVEGTAMTSALDVVAGDRVRVTVADERTPIVLTDADAAFPPVFAMVLPSVSPEVFLAPPPPRAA